METIGQKILLALDEIGISQRNLADQLGISHSAVSMWVSDKRIPKYPTIKKIANITKKPIDFFIEENEKNENSKVINKINSKKQLLNNNDMISLKDLHLVPIRIIGGVNAGELSFFANDKGEFRIMPFPIEFIIDIPVQTLSKNMIEQFVKRYIAYKITDDSMYDVLITDDTVIVDRDKLPENGDMILISTLDNLLYCKYFVKDNGNIILRSKNSKYKDIIINGSEIENNYKIHGVIVKTICKPRGLNL